MCKTKPFLDKESSLALYYYYVHSFLNYANLTWGSTYQMNLKKLHSQQKQALDQSIKRQNLNVQKNFSNQQMY